MLQIKNLHVKIGDKNILNGINLVIQKGEIHAIMGPNGSGKSTLASVIAGKENYRVTKGEIIFNELDLLSLSPEHRAALGVFLSFQYPVEIPGLSLINFLKTIVCENQKIRLNKEISSRELLKKIRKTADFLGIDQSFLSRSVNEGFSGGEKKRNEIFQMIMLDPKLVILDETDSGLDIDALKIISNGVNLFKNIEKSVLVITHYQRLLDYIVPNFVHVLFNGKIVKTGDKNLPIELEKRGYDWIIN